MGKTNDYANRAVALLLVLAMLASCAPGLSGKEDVRTEILRREGARLIDAYYADVRAVLVDEGVFTEEEMLSHGTLDGDTITRGLMGEECGGEMLSFLAASSSSASTSEILEKARPLVGEREYSSLEVKVRELEEEMGERGERIARTLSSSQREEFYKDLRSLVVKSTVLLTAAVVYACMPKVMFWGKVSAATAVSVAAGVVASTLITIVEWSDIDTKQNPDAFEKWLTNVTAEPFAAWALAQGVITAQSATTTSPVVAALVLGVFAIYHVTDGVKTLMSKYNWKV